MITRFNSFISILILMGTLSLNTYAQFSVEEDIFYAALKQEIDFIEADWLENNISNRDIVLGTAWLSESDQEKYLGQSIYPDKELLKRLQNKGKGKGDIAVLLVVITNKSKYRIVLDGQEAKIVDDKNQSYSRSELSQVIKKFKYKFSGFFKVLTEVSSLGLASSKAYDEMRLESLRANLLKKSLKRTVVEPNESIASIFFLPATSILQDSSISIPIQNLRRLVYLEMSAKLPNNI